MRSQLVAVFVLAAALAGCSSSAGTHAAGSHSSPPSTSIANSGPTPSAPPPASASSPGPDASTVTQPSPRTSLNGLQVKDVTFVGDQGWVLGTAGCVHRSGRCAVLGHSTDSGRNWSALAVPPAGVSHLRFATDKVGYAFGRAALFMTTNGGRTWQRQAGGADALESLDGNVIRVTDPGDCPPGCTYSVEIAGVGSASWHRVALPGGQGGGDSVQLVRTGNVSALEVYGNPAGGAAALASLFTSRDNGAGWTRRGEPCPAASGPNHEIDSSLLASAPDGSITILCTNRGATGPQFTTTSTDGGVTFHVGDRSALGAGGVSALGAASARTLLISSDDTYRSTDGGRHFARLSANSGSSPGQLSWLGFASATVGHGISVDRRTIWITADAGRTWSAATVH